MDRRKELESILSEMSDSVKLVNSNLIDDVLFLEEKLEYLRTLPFIEVNPRNPMQQKPTIASKQYKELLQQYSNLIKILLIASKKGEVEEESPLRAYLKKFKEV